MSLDEDFPDIPNNSSAEIDPVTGRVVTDRGKRPVEQEDITAMIEADLEADEATKKRNIVDTRGKL